MVERFLQLLSAGDAEGISVMLAEDVVLTSDGGGEVVALAKPLQGKTDVLRLLARLGDVYRSRTKITLLQLNCEPAALFVRSEMRKGHAQRFTMHCELNEEGRISNLYFVFSPQKLEALP